MTNWYEQQVEAGHLKRRRPLSGEPVYVQDIEPGVRYRFPYSQKGHLAMWRLIGTDNPLTWCGLPIFVDEQRWVESGEEYAYGPYIVVEDTRKGGKCGPCSTKEKEVSKHISFEELHGEVHESKESLDFSDVRGMLWDMDVIAFRRRCESVRRQLGGTYAEV